MGLQLFVQQVLWGRQLELLKLSEATSIRERELRVCSISQTGEASEAKATGVAATVAAAVSTAGAMGAAAGVAETI